MVFRKVESADTYLDESSRDRFKRHFIGKDAIPVFPGGDRDVFMCHFAEVLAIVRHQHLYLAGVVNPSPFVGKGVETHLLDGSGLFQIDDGIQGIRFRAGRDQY